MMKIPYGKQHITQEDIDSVVEALGSDFLTQGPRIEKFENAFADYVGSKYAVAVINGTAALHLACLALDTNNKSKVVTSPITFVASANCVLYCDGKVDFIDISDENFCLDVDKLEAYLERGEKIEGVIPVHFAGYPLDLERISLLANKFKFWIIEDACHAVGASFTTVDGSKMIGSCYYSDMAVFSFHPVKHIACGEGGMITTNDETLYQKLVMLRSHQLDRSPELQVERGAWFYQVSRLGYNFRITDIQAALGHSQLKRIEENLKRRREIAQKYNQELINVGDLRLPEKAEKGEHAYHLYVVRTKKRKELYDFLKDKNIFCQVHYVPVHTQPLYGYTQKLPCAENYYDECLSIPMYHSLTEEEQNFVISQIRDFFKS